MIKLTIKPSGLLLIAGLLALNLFLTGFNLFVALSPKPKPAAAAQPVEVKKLVSGMSGNITQKPSSKYPGAKLAKDGLPLKRIMSDDGQMIAWQDDQDNMHFLEEDLIPFNHSKSKYSPAPAEMVKTLPASGPASALLLK